MLQHYRHNLHARRRTIVANSEQHATTCELYSYVIAIGGDYNLFPLVAHVTLHSQHPADVPARGAAHVAANCHMGCQNGRQLSGVLITVLQD